MSKPTMRDRWASRTIRFNSFMTAVSIAIMPVVVTMSEAQWQQLGFDKKWALVAVLAVQVLSNMKNINLRGKTSRPLSGRAE